MLHRIIYPIPEQKPFTTAKVCDTPIYEKTLLETWLNVQPGTIFNDRRGHPIMVINPGVMNHNEGPDINDAVIFTGGRFLTGDIECHIRSRDWFYHGHKGDRNYNNVILHITAIPDRSDYALKGQLIILNPGVGNLKCNLSKKNVRHSVADTLIQFGLDRWSRRMKYYGTADWKTRILEDSFKLLGKGGNEKQFLKLLRFFKNGLRLGDPNLNEISWRYRRIRPNAWPEKRMDIAYQLYDWIEKEVWVHRLDLCFLERIVSHGLAVELVGNIFNPMAAQRCLAAGNISGFRSCKEEWLDLKLGYSYGRFEKQFHGLLTSRQLKSFPVLQGLIALEKLFCKNRHCLVCPLKQTHGTA